MPWAAVARLSQHACPNTQRTRQQHSRKLLFQQEGRNNLQGAPQASLSLAANSLHRRPCKFCPTQ